jgi:hypothetical protein
LLDEPAVLLELEALRRRITKDYLIDWGMQLRLTGSINKGNAKEALLDEPAVAPKLEPSL